MEIQSLVWLAASYSVGLGIVPRLGQCGESPPLQRPPQIALPMPVAQNRAASIDPGHPYSRLN